MASKKKSFAKTFGLLNPFLLSGKGNGKLIIPTNVIPPSFTTTSWRGGSGKNTYGRGAYITAIPPKGGSGRTYITGRPGQGHVFNQPPASFTVFNQARPEEAETLYAWATDSDPEVTIDELREIPFSFFTELYDAKPDYPKWKSPKGEREFKPLRPAGPQWEAFKRLMLLANYQRTLRDIAILDEFIELWKPYVDDFISSSVIKSGIYLIHDPNEKSAFRKEERAFRPAHPVMPFGLPDCYTVWAIESEISRLCFSNWGSLPDGAVEARQKDIIVETALAHSAGVLFTPWAKKVATLKDVQKSADLRTSYQERNALAPLRKLAAHFFEDDQKSFDILFGSK